MRARFRSAGLAVALLFAASVAGAEPLGSYLTLTPFAGMTTFDGSLLFPGSSPLQDVLYAGGRLGWYSHHGFGLEAAGGFTPTREIAAGGTDVNFGHGSGNLVVMPFRARTGDVFVTAGYGYGRLQQVKPASGVRYGTFELGGGVRFWMADAIGLRLEVRNVALMQKDPIKPLYNNLVFGAGLELAIGARTRDTDGDGVGDKKDRCPNTLKGARVDANGCPLDTDGDAIFDGIDQCAGTPKGCKVNGKGCPSDADGDAVCDGIDNCPDTPRGATVDVVGCPIDSDGDGVFDGIDKCPGTPKGCSVDSMGCPRDTDGDGVCDGADQCRETPAGANVDVSGCPIEVIERETELMDTGKIRLQNVNFETGKVDLLPEDFGTLDIVGQVLSKWSELRVEIGGHTDSRGSAERNQKLSEARASAVLTYIVQKFPNLKADQFTVKGYGFAKPIVPNSNALNMARNRRVEFVIQNKDVLRREIQRRRLLQKSESPATTSAPADTTRKP